VGLSLSTTLFHFIELEGKYNATMDDAHCFNTLNAMANLYVTRSLGFSCRYKYFEKPMGGVMEYLLFGVAFIF